MVRVLVAVLLLLALATVVMVILASRSTPRRPSPFASNTQWERYYRDMASQARGDGNEASAAEYESLARTYAGLGEDLP